MIAQLIAYAVLVGAFLAVSGLALEWLAGAWQQPRRWVWVGMLAASVAIGIGVPMARRAPAPSTVVASGFLARRSLGEGGSRTTSSVVVSAPIVVTHSVVASGLSRTTPEAQIQPTARIDLLAIIRDAAARVDPIARTLWPWACAALLLFHGAGHLTLASRRRAWPAREVNGVRVLISRDIGPAVIGILRPQIVLPEWTIGRDDRALGFMLRHEQEHQRARDPLLIHLARTVVLVMPWNPAAWWMLSRLKLAIECDCDRRVLAGAAESERLDYGEVLLAVGAHGASRHAFLGPAMLERSSSLARRIVAMQRARLRFLPVRVTAAAGVALATLSTILLLPAPRLRAAAVSSTVTGNGTVGQDVALASDRIRLDKTILVTPATSAAQRPVPPGTPPPPVDGVYEPGNGVSWPTLIKQVEPQYTKAARDAKIQGTVHLSGVVETNGTTGRIQVTRSLDAVHGLDQAAIDAASKWTFAPCKKDGNAVPCRIHLELDFRLHGSPSADAPAGSQTTPANAASLSEVYEPGNGVSWPVLIGHLNPTYTRAAMDANVQGTVYLSAVVGTDGSLGSIRVTKSLDSVLGLDQAAIDAASKWTFRPCTKDDKPVACRVSLELDFRLDRPPNTSVSGYLWTADNQPIASGIVQLRNTTSGQVEMSTSSNTVGEFLFKGMKSGTYVIEYVNGSAANANVIAVGSPFNVKAGETVATFVRTLQGADEFVKGTYNEGDVTGLKVLRMVDPKYTSDAMRQKIQGEVTVQVVVGTKGTVDRARVIESLDKVYGLDNSALEAAKKSLFEPGKIDGRPVPTLTTITLTFRLH